MIDKEILASQIILVGMNEAEVSTIKQPYIGTTALATCVGLIIYNRQTKQALVSHLSVEWKYVIEEILIKLLENNFISEEEYIKLKGIFSLYEKYFFDIPNMDENLKIGLINKYNFSLKERDEQEKLEFLIIPGYYKNNYNICEEMTDFFLSLQSVFSHFKGKTHKNDINHNEMITSNEFVFDSLSGTFITNQINIDKVVEEKNKLNT